MNNLCFTVRQSRKNSRFSFAALLIVILLAATGCHRTTHVTTAAAGHQINADIEGNHSIESQTNQCVISSQFGKITVERSRVQLDDARWTTIPEDVPVRLRISSGKLWVNAGSVTTSRTVD